MPKQEGSSQYTGETGNPLAQKSRRTATGWATDTQAHMGDGMFATQGLRKAGGGTPVAKRKRGMR